MPDLKWRKVKRALAEDKARGGKQFHYYFITINKQDYKLDWNGWKFGNIVQSDNIGYFVVIQGITYYLES